MLDSLQLIYNRLLDETTMTFYRYLFDSLDLKSRLTGIVGPRGVGKTTLMLQYIKKHINELGKTFYFSADHIYFKDMTIYAFVEELFVKESIKTFFIDEIHKYPNWSQELKNLYDGFPDIKIIFSGSSSLDLIKGHYDLSRRGKVYKLPGLSFREYLNLKNGTKFSSYPFKTLIGDKENICKKLAAEDGILSEYHEYLKQGFYPFAQEDPLSYYEKLLAVVEKTIYEDIANFYNLKTSNLRYLSKILNYLATVPPGKISTYNLGKNLGIDDKTASGYLLMLHETGLVDILYSSLAGNQGLRKPEKVFFNNTNLHNAIGGHAPTDIEIGTIRELAFVQATKNAGLDVYHSKQAEYQIQNYVFEVGGKNKTAKQIKALDESFLVKDDTLSVSKRTIPLFLLGFLY